LAVIVKGFRSCEQQYCGAKVNFPKLCEGEHHAQSPLPMVGEVGSLRGGCNHVPVPPAEKAVALRRQMSADIPQEPLHGGEPSADLFRAARVAFCSAASVSSTATADHRQARRIRRIPSAHG
jgi:hypothetical protein